MENTKPEAQHKAVSETGMSSSDSTSQQQQQQPDISPGAYPAPLQTAGSSSEPRSRSRTGSSPPRRPDAAETSSSKGHERMPSVNSLPPKDGHFGVVSNSGQLVCAFGPPPAGTSVAEAAPQPPPKVVPEAYITSASFATNSQSNLRGESVSPPLPQQQTSPLSGGAPTVSTLELVIDHNSYPEAVDRNNYPEVYFPDSHHQQQQQQQQNTQSQDPETKPPQRQSSPPTIIPRKSLPMDGNNNGSNDFYHPSPPLVSSPPAPAYSSPSDYQRIGYTGTLDMSTAVATVTPLHMLGDQPDTVDCPFCQRRVETRVKKKASSKTHTWGAILFFSTLFGVVAPYCCDWYVNVEHYCKNCSRKVAHKRFDSDETVPLGTRPEDRQVSYFQPAEKPAKKKFRS